MPVAKVVNERIPQGRYWSDVFEANRLPFDTWLDYLVKDNLGHLEHAEEFEDQSRAFVIYVVTAELGAPWPADVGLPPPNIAGPSIKSASDTVTRPDAPKGAIDTISDAVSGVAKAGTFAIVAVILVAAISALKRR